MAKKSATVSLAQLHKGWGRSARILASLLIAWHVTAVFIGPWSLDRSALSAWLLPVYQPYLRAVNLDHGYRFFAPEPGPAHLVRYEITGLDGVKLTGEFPNLREHQPRLLYHRHFMLSEFLNRLESDIPNFPNDYQPTSQEVAVRNGRLAMRNRLVESFARHLLQEHQGKSVHLYLRRHLIPMPGLVAAGIPLSDPRFFEELDLGEYPPVAEVIPATPQGGTALPPDTQPATAPTADSSSRKNSGGLQGAKDAGLATPPLLRRREEP